MDPLTYWNRQSWNQMNGQARLRKSLARLRLPDDGGELRSPATQLRVRVRVSAPAQNDRTAAQRPAPPSRSNCSTGWGINE